MANMSQSEIIYLIFIGSSGMLLLIGGIAVFIAVYQRNMLKTREYQKKKDEDYERRMIQLQFESQEKDRKRIAADLHDSVGSLLWGAKLAAAYIERSGMVTASQKASHKELMEILDQSIQTVKKISWELTPEAFHYSGLSQSLATLCVRIDGKGLEVRFNEKGETIIWNDDRALQVYRIVQELVSNTIKHAHASQLSVSLSWAPTLLSIEVGDDGIGFILDEKRTGIGWWNIRHRVNQLNANIAIGLIPMGKGCQVKLTIPLEHAK